MFLEASGNGNNLEQPVIHENAAHFVPPPIAMELPPPLPGPTSVEVPPPLPGNLSQFDQRGSYTKLLHLS